MGAALQSENLVLVVEDDGLSAMSVEAALADAGFIVDVADSAIAAVGLLEEKPGGYRALITDVNMGKDRPTGWDVAKHARELDSAIPVVYMTGESAREWSAYGVPESVMVEKPFAPVQIVTAVAQLINLSHRG
jgi:DNA-binding response OmpR family regulator